jgi:hypothetical protein
LLVARQFILRRSSTSNQQLATSNFFLSNGIQRDIRIRVNAQFARYIEGGLGDFGG